VPQSRSGNFEKIKYFALAGNLTSDIYFIAFTTYTPEINRRMDYIGSLFKQIKLIYVSLLSDTSLI
jgi:hypothetical protein